MKIDVMPKEGRKEIRTIFVDGEPWRDIHTSIFGKNFSFPPCATRTEWKVFFEKWEYQRVKNYVIWRLSTQPYHSEQLQKLLRERLVRQQTITKVLEECLSSGYLNDEAWIESFMRNQQKKNGLRSILLKLQAKGLTAETVQEIRSNWNRPEEEKEAILSLLRTRYRSKNLNDFREKQKTIASLMRKGYAFEQIQSALETFSELN